MYFMSSPSLVDNLLLNYRVNSLPSSDDLANTTVPFYNNSACWLWDMHELVCTYHHHEFNIHPSLLSNETEPTLNLRSILSAPDTQIAQIRDSPDVMRQFNSLSPGQPHQPLLNQAPASPATFSYAGDQVMGCSQSPLGSSALSAIYYVGDSIYHGSIVGSTPVSTTDVDTTCYVDSDGFSTQDTCNSLEASLPIASSPSARSVDASHPAASLETQSRTADRHLDGDTSTYTGHGSAATATDFDGDSDLTDLDDPNTESAVAVTRPPSAGMVSTSSQRPLKRSRDAYEYCDEQDGDEDLVDADIDYQDDADGQDDASDDYVPTSGTKPRKGSAIRSVKRTRLEVEVTPAQRPAMAKAKTAQPRKATSNIAKPERHVSVAKRTVSWRTVSGGMFRCEYCNSTAAKIEDARRHFETHSREQAKLGTKRRLKPEEALAYMDDLATMAVDYPPNEQTRKEALSMLQYLDMKPESLNFAAYPELRKCALKYAKGFRRFRCKYWADSNDLMPEGVADEMWISNTTTDLEQIP